MIDPDIELKRRVYNDSHYTNLTYEQFCLMEIKQMQQAEKIDVERKASDKYKWKLEYKAVK